jgi:hypothetical protein
MARKRLGEILLAAGVIDEARLRAALAEQRRWGGPLGRILIDMHAVTEDAMVQALSHQLNFPTVNLDERPITTDVLDLVPAELAEQHSVVPFMVQGKFLDVAMADPTNLGIIDELRIRTRLNVRPHLVGPKMLERALARHYGRGVGTLNLTLSAQAALGNAAQGPAQVPAGTRLFDEQMGGVDRPQRATLPFDPGTPAPAQTGSAATARRAGQADLLASPASPSPNERDREILALQTRVQHLEALVARDEDVLRKLMGLLIEKGLATREEILERISQ